MQGLQKTGIFDADWLQYLAGAFREHADPGIMDLYLERRLDISMEFRDGLLQIEEGRSEGAALRSATSKLRSLRASTGISPRSIASLLTTSELSRSISRYAPRIAPPLEGPEDWRRQTEEFLIPFESMDLRLRILIRHAALIHEGSFQLISCPTLLRLEFEAPHRGRLLSVWDHPDLETWRAQLLESAPRRAWRPPSGESFPVILVEGCSGPLFHEIAGHLLEGDLLGKHDDASRLGQKTGAPENLRVSDDPSRADLPGAFSCDDEGFPAQEITLIEGGIFQHALCDRETAAKLGLEPGRGRRAHWNSPPRSRMSNIIIAPGETEPQDFESSLKSGLLITQLAGASFEPRAGRIQLRVEAGWEVRRGRRRRPLSPFLLGAGIEELLGNIDPNIGSDRSVDWRLGWCFKDGLPLPTGSEGPSLLIRKMEVI